MPDPFNQRNTADGTASRGLTRIDGVFSGGGSLGMAYVGALRALEDHGFWFTRVAGTSVGAMFSALISAGYDAAGLEWLFAPPGAGVPRPDSVPASVREPVDISSFLDYPESSREMSPATMRSTHLWKAIKLNAVDELLGRQLSILPTRRELVDDLAAKIDALPFSRPERFRDRVMAAIGAALHFYPDDRPAIRNFLPGTLEHLREEVADRAWRAFADNVAEYRLFVSWAFEGGFFEGRVLYETMRALLQAKVWETEGATDRPVTFRDLPLELAVTSTDTSHPDRAKRLQVRTKLTDADMEVALAVRESASVPLFFQPRTVSRDGTVTEVMDGGVISNYPFWLLTEEENRHFDATTGEDARPRIGFILDYDLDAPSDWGCPEPKWHAASSTEGRFPHHVEALSENPEFAYLSPTGPFGEFSSMERALRVIEVFMGAELTLTEQWRSRVRESYPYHEVFIPLKGYHPLDFTVNRDPRTWRGMVDRGYEAAAKTLVSAGLVTARVEGPYRR